MTFPGGLLSSLLTQGVNAAGAAQKARLEANQMALSNALQAMMYQRQFNTQDIQNTLTQARTKEAIHSANKLQLGDDGYAQSMGDVAGAEENARTPAKVAQAVQTKQQTSPIETQTALNTARGMVPIDINKARGVAEATLPFDIQKAGAEAQARLPAELQVAATRAGFTPRAQNARASLPQMQTAAETMTKFFAPGSAGRLFGRSALGGYLVSPEGQIANQAADQFVSAYLGARAIRNPTPAMIEFYKKQIQPQPGEEGNATVLEKKRQRVQQMLDEVNSLGVEGSLGAITGGVHSVLGKYGIAPSQP